MKKNLIKPSILPGFMELLPKEQEIFNDIVYKITEIYKKNGCLPMDTPIIEKAEVLLAKSGGETEKQVYSISKGKNDLVLRFDLTVPFARYVAQYYNEIIFPFKRYQVGKVYRGERNQKGRYREFYQCDVDVIGKGSLSINNDAWVISLASKAFKAINLSNYKFQISNRKILKGILEELKIDNVSEVMTLIDKYDKVGEIEFVQQLEILVGEERSNYINQIIEINGTNEQILNKLLNANIKNEYYAEGVKELLQIKVALKILGVDDSEYVINLKIIRGLDYYTGTVFETLLVGNEGYGSICSGGRYDKLTANYSNFDLSGVGISIGITRLFFILKEIGFVDRYEIGSTTTYLIIPIGDTLEFCGKLMNQLEQKGDSVSIYFEEDSLKKKISYANKLNIDNVILVGEDEVRKNKVKIKNMKSGNEDILELE